MPAIRQKSVFRGATRVLSSGTLASWVPVPLVRSRTPLASITQDGLRPVVLCSRSRPSAQTRVLSGPGAGPTSGPRAAGVSGVNAGESLEPCRGSCKVRQQVTGSVVLAAKCRSGTRMLRPALHGYIPLGQPRVQEFA